MESGIWLSYKGRRPIEGSALRTCQSSDGPVLQGGAVPARAMGPGAEGCVPREPRVGKGVATHPCNCRSALRVGPRALRTSAAGA
eukprot:6274830-Pyramimonas_sp.AAC.1